MSFSQEFKYTASFESVLGPVRYKCLQVRSFAAPVRQHVRHFQAVPPALWLMPTRGAAP